MGANRISMDPSIKRTLAQELEARGYDLTTLRFSICKKPEPESSP